MVDVLHDSCKKAHLSVKIKSVDVEGFGENNQERLDIYIQGRHFKEPMVIDVAVTYATQNKNLKSIAANEIASHITSVADVYGSRVKDTHYKERVEKSGLINFSSVVADHLGAWNQDGLKTIKTLGACLNDSDSLHWNRNKGTYHLFQRLSAALQIQNAKMIRSRFNEYI